MYRELRNAVRAAGSGAGTAPPHPSTDAWRALGLDLDAPTLAAQFDQLNDHHAYSHGGDLVAFGDTSTSGLTRALVELTGAASEHAIVRALRYVCELAPDAPLVLAAERRFASLTAAGTL